jgi:hypothetical protein
MLCISFDFRYAAQEEGTTGENGQENDDRVNYGNDPVLMTTPDETTHSNFQDDANKCYNVNELEKDEVDCSCLLNPKETEHNESNMESDTDTSSSKTDAYTEQIGCAHPTKQKEEIDDTYTARTKTPEPTDTVKTGSVECTATEQNEATYQMSPSNSDGLMEHVSPADIVLDEMYTPHYPAAPVPVSVLTNSASDVSNDINAPSSFKELTNLEDTEVNEKLSTETSSHDGDNYTQDADPTKKPGEVDTPDLPTDHCRKKASATSDHMTTTSSEAVLDGHNKPTLKQKRQLREERFKKYVAAPEEVREAWNIFGFLDCEIEPDISRHSTLEECKDKRCNEIKGNRLRLEDREIFFKSDKDVSESPDQSPMIYPQSNTKLDTEIISTDGAMCTQEKSPTETPGKSDNLDLPTDTCRIKSCVTSDQMTISTEAVLEGHNQLTFKQNRQLREERFKKYVAAPKEVRKAWNIFGFLNSEIDPDISGNSTLEECKDKRYNEIRGNRLRLEDRQILNKSDKDKSESAHQSPNEYPQSNMKLGTDTISSDGAMCTQDIHPMETPGKVETPDLPRALCRKKSCETPDQMTISTEAVLDGHNQLTLKQKRQLREERFKKYVAAPEEVREAWNIFGFLDSEIEPDISRHSTLEECKDKRCNETKVNRLRLEDRQIFSTTLNDISESAGPSAEDCLNTADIGNNVTSEVTNASVCSAEMPVISSTVGDEFQVTG